MKTITRLAISNDCKNKVRSILVTITIFLSTLLLTVILTYGYGIIKTNKVNSGNEYGSYYGIYQSITDEQIEELKHHSEFTDIGLLSYAGTVQSESNLGLYWGDATSRELTNLSKKLETGTFPEKAEEIAASPEFFQALGYENVAVGDTITLSSRMDLNSKYTSKKFIISGLLQKNDVEMSDSSYIGYVSKTFLNQQVPEESQRYNAYFRLDESVSITIDDAEEVLKELAEKCGIEEKQVSANQYYLIWALDPGMETITMCGILVLLIILFTIIVIYNIFQVGIIQKVQEYGKIKALGATKKQMKQLIFREGMLMGIVGVPTGILAGFLIAKGSFEWLRKQAESLPNQVEQIPVSLFSAPILLLAAGLSVITIWLALKKPMRIVASISPIEAIRYQENKTIRKGRKNKQNSEGRKGKTEVSVMAITMANISSNRKRTISTIFTMGFSCVLFVVIANFVGNIDVNYDARQNVEYGQFELWLDYDLNDTAYPENNLNHIIKNNPFSKEFLEQVKEIRGASIVKTSNLLSATIEGKPQSVLVLDREAWNRYMEDGGVIGKKDYDTVAKENGVFYGWSHFMEEEGISQNQKISLELSDGSREKVLDTTVMGAVGDAGPEWVITKDTFQNMGFDNASVGSVWVDCSDKDRKQVQNALDKLIEGSENIEISSFQDAFETTAMSVRIVQLAAYSFLAIVGLIGFLNMANTMIISIITRKQELGVLQAVGMTNRQLNRSLQMEGLVFTLGTVIISGLVGIPLGYAFFCFGKQRGFIGLHNYQFPAAEMAVMMVCIMALQLLLSFFLSRNVKRESLVERIRFQD